MLKNNDTWWLTNSVKTQVEWKAPCPPARTCGRRPITVTEHVPVRHGLKRFERKPTMPARGTQFQHGACGLLQSMSTSRVSVQHASGGPVSRLNSLHQTPARHVARVPLPIAARLKRRCFTKFYFALYDGTNLPASLHISTCHAVTCGWPSLARMALHSAWRAAHRATAPHATRGSDMSHGEAKGFMTPVGPAAMIRTTYVLEPRAH